MNMKAFNTILCATDLSAASIPALKMTKRLAEALGARVVLAHVLPAPAELSIPNAMIPLVAPPDPTATFAALRNRAHEELLEAAERDLGPDIEWEICFGEGAAAPEISRLAKDKRADLVVIGTHGRTGLSRVLIGSVAESVVRKAPCAVLTVRSKDL